MVTRAISAVEEMHAETREYRREIFEARRSMSNYYKANFPSHLLPLNQKNLVTKKSK